MNHINYQKYKSALYCLKPKLWRIVYSGRHYESTQSVAQQEKISNYIQNLEEYKRADDYFNQGKYRLSEEFFKRILQKLDTNNKVQDHIHILRRMTRNSLALRQSREAERYFNLIIKLRQESLQKGEKSKDLYYEYQNLFIYYLKTNLNRAITLGNDLMTGNKTSNIPDEYKPLFEFHLGNAHLLKGNYVQAKQKLKQSINIVQDNTLKGYAYNNLAVANWWHKYPNFQDLQDEENENQVTQSPQKNKGNNNTNQIESDEEEDYPQDKIDSDFENTISLFKKAIINIENVSDLQDQKLKSIIENFLNQDTIQPQDFQKYDPSAKLLFQVKASGKPIMNIGEFLLSTNPQKKSEAIFWFKYAMKFFEMHDPQSIDRGLITLGHFCSSTQQYLKAEGLYRKTLDMLENSNSYNKVLCLRLYGNMLKKIPNRSREAEKAYELENALPYWASKIVHLNLPEFIV